MSRLISFSFHLWHRAAFPMVISPFSFPSRCFAGSEFASLGNIEYPPFSIFPFDFSVEGILLASAFQVCNQSHFVELGAFSCSGI